MVEYLSLFFTVYIAVKIYISVMQIGYLQRAKFGAPVILTPNEYAKSADYSIKKERIAILETLLEYVLFIFWFSFGIAWLDEAIAFESIYLEASAVVLGFVVLNYIVGVPFDIYRTFVLDRSFGFSTTTPKIFISDLFISALLGALFGLPLISAIVYFMESFESWWIYGFGFTFLVGLFINAIFPTLIAPLFNKITPLEQGELKAEIEGLLNRVGFKASGIFVADASKRDNRLNAYFGGFGKTKRVVLFDTLINKLNKNELIAVLSHELGHFKHGDIFKNIAIMALFLFVSFGVFGNLPQELFLELGLSDNPQNIITLFMLLSSPFFFFLQPLVSLFSRSFEYKADEFASVQSSKSDMVSALLKLVNENKSFPRSHPLVIFFYYSHPPILERLRALGYDAGEVGGFEKEACSSASL